MTAVVVQSMTYCQRVTVKWPIIGRRPATIIIAAMMGTTKR